MPMTRAGMILDTHNHCFVYAASSLFIVAVAAGFRRAAKLPQKVTCIFIF